jgi:hypothetical protein
MKVYVILENFAGTSFINSVWFFEKDAKRRYKELTNCFVPDTLPGKGPYRFVEIETSDNIDIDLM